jgi:chromosomal replication initiator protein
MHHQKNNTDETETYAKIWSDIKKDLLTQYGEKLFNSWFSKMFFLDKQDNQVVLGVPNGFIKDWITNNYYDLILGLWHHYGHNNISLEIRIAENTQINEAIHSFTPPLSNAEENLAAESAFNTNLDRRFTFENFVVGSPNELAYSAARAVAEGNKAMPESNPLFLYGGVGLGKTHLMHSIAWHMLSHNAKRKFIYISAEKFMYQFVRALRNKNLLSFKEQFRSVDVLMIDDIQFICGKDSTQEEFFHTFNTLIDNHRQMVISCDRSPSDLDNVEDRIKSRLGWGLVADVHSTTYELRLGILESKIEQLKVKVPKDVIEFLASKVTSNVRELEGALNKVIAHSSLTKQPIALDQTKHILQDLLKSADKAILIEDIQKKVAHQYRIKITDMASTCRERKVARPRQIAMYLSKRLTPKSLSEIGRKFGNKDHTTIIHAIKKIEEMCASDQEFAKEIELFARNMQH